MMLMSCQYILPKYRSVFPRQGQGKVQGRDLQEQVKDKVFSVLKQWNMYSIDLSSTVGWLVR